MKKMNALNNVKIGFKDVALLFVMVAAVLVIFVMSMLNYSKTYDSAVKDAEDNIKERAEQCSTELEKIFAVKYEVLNYIASLQEIKSMDWQEQYQYLAGKAGGLGFIHMFIMYEDGTGHYVQGNSIIDQANEPFFRNVMKNETYITEPYINGGVATITLCTSIYRGDKKVGALCAVMRVDDIYNAVEDMQGNTTAVVITSTGKFIAADKADYVIRNLNLYDKMNEDSKNKEFISRGIESRITVVGDVVYEGQDYYAAMCKIPYGDWSMFVKVRKQDVVGNLENILAIQIASVVLLVFILIGTARFIHKMTTREKMAFVDSLTGINNRARCNIILDKMETNKKEDVMVVNFDLNDFKQINDTLGHEVGDEVLKVFGRILLKTFGKNGFVGRMGGDEFIVVLTGKEVALYEHLIQDMKDAVSNYNALSNLKYKLSVSYGNAVRRGNDSDSKTMEQLYAEADKNMYFYKETFKKARAAT